jgi:hypothetical protein
MQMGYHPVPVAPLGFETDKCPVRWDPHTKQFFKFKSWNTLPPVMDPQPGANIGALMGGAVVALDYDHDDAALAICEVFPDSPVNKVGERGWTSFYRVESAIPCEDFYNEDGELVLQILGAGKQTVLPPSIHPKTKAPYRWTNGHSLYDTPVESLPLLPPDYRERILKLGFQTTRPSKPKPDKRLNASDQGEPDGPYAELNQVAIRDLAKWVPQLNIYKLRRRVGRFANYEGVAQWRESTTGRPLEERALNLKISGAGIRDFGDGRGYSPIDLVMAARASSKAEAFCWLEEKLLPPKEDIKIDLDKIMEAQEVRDAPPIAPEPDFTENPDDAWVGKEWEDGDPVPAPLPMLIPYFVPLEPYLGYLWGQSQTYKTFLLNTMAVAVASGGRFAGYQVTEHGLVYQVELEGSRSQLRIQAAKQFAGITKRLPIVHVTKTPPALIGAGKRVSADWKKWASAIVRKAKAAAERWGVPLKLITIDPQNHFAGFTDEQSSAEGNVVCNALIAMAKDAGCPVLVADHLGKDPAAGGRGTSVKHQSPWFILDAGESAEELGEDRILIIRKMKDGEDGLGVSFHMEKFTAEIDQQVRAADDTVKIERAEHDTLIVVFEGDVRPVNTIKSDTENRLTDKEMIVLNTVSQMTNREGQELPPECGAPTGLRGLSIARLEIRITRNPSFAGKGKGSTLFKRMFDSLMAKKKIQGFEDWVCIPLTD